MTIEYRKLTESDLDAFEAAEDSAYSSGPHPEDRAAFREVFDYERSLAAFDNESIVGGACYFKLGLSIPDGQVNGAGVTFVFVVPSHRRKGIVTELMRRQLDMMRAENIPVSALHAAESGIYGRFGYGAAAHTETLEIERAHAGFAEPVRPAGNFRLVDDNEAAQVFPAVYEKYRATTPGLFARDALWWKLRLREHGKSSGSEGWMKIAYERNGEATAYAVYDVNLNWENALPLSRMQVEEIAYVDNKSYAAIWHYLLSVDLIKSVRAYAPVDPPIWSMLADRRRLNRLTRDGLWVRVVDVPAALSARSYLSEGSISIQIQDSFCSWNEGTYRLESSDGKVSCEPTDAKPDITLSAATLGAIYLGGSNLHTLAAAGLVEEHIAGAISTANAMFSWHTAPMTSAPEPLT